MFLRSFFIGLLLLSSSSGLMLGQDLAELKITTGVDTESAELTSENIRKILKDSKANFSYDEKPWSEIEEALEKKYSINFVLTTSARDDSLSHDEPISCELRNVRLDYALHLMLDENNATYTVKNGSVLIISKDDSYAEDYSTVKVIPVQKLIASLNLELGKQAMGFKPVSDSAPGVFGQTNPEEVLCELIQSSILTQTWTENGGLATIKIVAGCAVISANEQTYSMVEELLERLEATWKAK